MKKWYFEGGREDTEENSGFFMNAKQQELTVTETTYRSIFFSHSPSSFLATSFFFCHFVIIPFYSIIHKRMIFYR